MANARGRSLLVIDVGNTETVVGFYAEPEEAPARSDEGLRGHLRLATRPERTADETYLLVRQFMMASGLDPEVPLMGAIVSSSAPNVTQTVLDMVRRWFGVEPMVMSGALDTGLAIRYEQPREVGADRVADAVAAFALYGGPSIVVDLGTATTFDAISASGEYLGGAICPGVVVALEALVSRAAALRKVEIAPPRSVIGTTTVESIQSGVIYGLRGQVDAIVGAMVGLLGPATVIGTGGLAEQLAPSIPTIQVVEPWLTLHGLRLVWMRGSGHAG